MTTHKKLVSMAELARILGVSQAYVSKMSKSKFAEAMDGKRIDLDHSSVELFILKRSMKDPDKVTLDARLPSNKIKDEILAGTIKAPDDIELANFGSMTLDKILKIYGTVTRFKDLLSATKLIEDIIEKRIKNAKSSGDLISRHHVDTFMIGAYETLYIRLLQDSPRTISASVLAAWESGEKPEQVEIMIKDLLSTQLKSVQKEVTKAQNSA